MLRVCGATAERDPLSASGCWCRGFFCGRGGAKRSIEFRKTFHKSTPARSRAEFLDLLGQADLFDRLLQPDHWIRRFEEWERPRLRRVK